jgi:hypothetical protein
VVDEDVLRTLVLEVNQLRAVVRDERTGLHGARVPSRDGSASSPFGCAGVSVRGEVG